MREVGNLGAGAVAFTPDDLREIDSAASKIKIEGARLQSREFGSAKKLRVNKP
jgi:hypothetical protein